MGLGVLHAQTSLDPCMSFSAALTKDSQTDGQIGAMNNVTSNYFSSDLLFVKVNEVLQNENENNSDALY